MRVLRDACAPDRLRSAGGLAVRSWHLQCAPRAAARHRTNAWLSWLRRFDICWSDVQRIAAGHSTLVRMLAGLCAADTVSTVQRAPDRNRSHTNSDQRT